MKVPRMLFILFYFLFCVDLKCRSPLLVVLPFNFDFQAVEQQLNAILPQVSVAIAVGTKLMEFGRAHRLEETAYVSAEVESLEQELRQATGATATRHKQLDSCWKVAELFKTCHDVSVCVCHNEKKSAKQMASTTSDTSDTSSNISSSKHNANKHTTRGRGPFHQSITVILTGEKREAVANPTHVAVYLFRDLDRMCVCCIVCCVLWTEFLGNEKRLGTTPVCMTNQSWLNNSRQ